MQATKLTRFRSLEEQLETLIVVVAGVVVVVVAVQFNTARNYHSHDIAFFLGFEEIQRPSLKEFLVPKIEDTEMFDKGCYVKLVALSSQVAR